MTITVRRRPLKATRTPSKSCRWLGEAIVNGRDGEHVPDTGHSRDRDGTAGFDPKQALSISHYAPFRPLQRLRQRPGRVSACW